MLFTFSLLISLATSASVAVAAPSARRAVDLTQRSTCAPDLSNGTQFNIQLSQKADSYNMGSSDCEACHTEGYYQSSEDIFARVESPAGAAEGNFRIHPTNYGSMALQYHLDSETARVTREIAPDTYDPTFDSWSIECSYCYADEPTIGASCQVVISNEAQNLRQCLTSDGVVGVGNSHITTAPCGNDGQDWSIVRA